jgi:membrane protein YdbS with pleckstrin-like domain
MLMAVLIDNFRVVIYPFWRSNPFPIDNSAVQFDSQESHTIVPRKYEIRSAPLTTPTTSTSTAPLAVEKEKIIFEIKTVMWPTIINFENLVTIGFVILATIAAVVFHFGLYEILIVAAVFLLITVPSFRTIFKAGSTTYVLTNRRLVIFTVGFGAKEQSIPLERIQKVSCKSSGFQRFYRAGDILIQQKGLRSTVRLIGLVDCKRRSEQILKAVQRVSG